MLRKKAPSNTISRHLIFRKAYVYATKQEQEQQQQQPLIGA